MNRRDFKKEKKKKSTAMIVIAVIALLTLFVGIFTLAFSNGFLRDKNKDNLIEVNETYVESKRLLYGVELDVKEDGTIKVKGDTEQNEDVLIQTLELEPGTYTISGINEPNLGKIVLSAQWGTGNVAYAGLSTDTFTLAEKTEVRIVLSIVDCEEGISQTNRTIRPCLVKGEEPGSFYA